VLYYGDESTQYEPQAENKIIVEK
jgi:hypothetical protein